MPAYLVANITVDDPETFKTYQQGVPAVVARHGGRYLVRGGRIAVKEGDPAASRLVVIEFPTIEAAEAFYASDDYADLLKTRLASASGWLMLVEGV